MLTINKEKLRDKIYACWLGKNLGGTLGAPFEAYRGVVECDGLTTEPGKPLPNDDLDLQLIWLKAMAEVGPKALNAAVLGEYWSEYITPYWAEYGICKSNMRDGLIPPLSGQYRNPKWKHSNGAWIRTEIWASLYPGDVRQAVRFATEDASVDHGMGEGTYAAKFVAAMESAAFFVDDLRELIRIGLSHIPTGSKMYTYVTTVVNSFDEGKTWLETRNLITDMTLVDEGLGWMQAPANVGYALIGLLWGAGDFKESLLIACRCGDDTDCSCATAGSLLGIMHGTAIIPQDWREHIGDDIVTVSLNMGAIKTFHEVNRVEHFEMPMTCTALTDCVMALVLATLTGRPVGVVDGEGADDPAVRAWFEGHAGTDTYYDAHFFYAESILATYRIAYAGTPDIAPGETVRITVRAHNKFLSQKIMHFHWILPEGWQVSGKKSAYIGAIHEGEPEYVFDITAGEQVEAMNTAILQITFEGHHDMALIPVKFVG